MLKRITLAPSLALLAFTGWAAGEEATTQPSPRAASQPASQPAPGSFEAIQLSAKAVQKKYLALVPKNDVLADANAVQRAAIAGEAVPLLKELLSDLDGMLKAKPAYKWQILALRPQFEAALVAFGDAVTLDRLTALVKQPGREGLAAKRVLLRARWDTAGQDPAKQEPVLADVEQLARDQPTDTFLAQLVNDIGTSATDPDIRQQMTSVLTDTMDNMTADGLVAAAKAKQKVESNQGRPMVLAGKLPDGRDFSTADWKGKVILVDFWAVWCVPCREELPRVKKVYEQYHAQGLEVLGVDNNDPEKTLTAFTARENLPWPQLFDAAAAAAQKWHPVTRTLGIDGIPVMVLIDKKGVCRTVTARDDFEKLIPQMLAE